METNVIWRNARAAVIELDDGGYFTCADTWEIFVNDEPAGTTNTVETYVDGLTPGKRNLIRFVCGERELSVGVTTPAEPFTINVRDCGAKGDAEHDDTTNIQAAIMACPKGGRVLIPAGNYRIKSLFLKSNINIELAEGAVLLARHDRAALAYIPGTVTGDEGAGYAGTDMLPLGRWEGESFSTYCSTFTGLSVHDVCIYGRGAIDGPRDRPPAHDLPVRVRKRESCRLYRAQQPGVEYPSHSVRARRCPVPVHRGSQELPQHRRFRSRELRFCPHPWLSVLGGRRLHRHQERQTGH